MALDAVADGGDPAADKKTKLAAKQAEQSETFAAALQPYLAKRRKDLRPRSFEEVERHLVKGCAPLHKLPLASIDRRKVALQLSEIETESGPVDQPRTDRRQRATAAPANGPLELVGGTFRWPQPNPLDPKLRRAILEAELPARSESRQ